MNDDNPRSLFENLAPPSGGLSRLHATLNGDTVPKQRPSYALATSLLACVAVIAVVALLALPWLTAPTPASKQEVAPMSANYGFDDPNLVILGLAEPPSEAVTLTRHDGGSMALRQVPLKTDDVVMYLVSGPRKP